MLGVTATRNWVISATWFGSGHCQTFYSLAVMVLAVFRAAWICSRIGEARHG